jgi:vancomycin resistance protein YoaR
MLQRIHITRFLRVFLLLVLQMIVCSGIALYLSGGLESKPNDNVTYALEIKVAGVDIGGLSFSEAQEKLNRFLQVRKGSSLQVTLNGKTFPILLQDINVTYDVPGSLLEAQRVSQERSGIWGMWKRWRGTASSPDLPLRVTFNQERLTTIINEIAKNVERPAVPATAKVNGTAITLVPEAEGYKVDVAKTIFAIQDELQTQKRNFRVSLVVKKDTPQITRENLKDIKVMLAEYSIPIDTSIPNRLFNAEQAARFINGVVLLPNQIFSFYEKAGPYTEAKGYIPVPIIKDEDAQDGVAGGAVQAASALYIAAVKSGLPIIERHNNARPVSSIPIGYDAFVRGKEIDLRFVNRMKEPVYIHSEITNQKLRVAIFGAKKVPSVLLETKEESKIVPETIVRADNKLAPGAEKIIRHGKEGRRVKVFVSRHEADGSVKTELLSDDYYKPLHNIVAFGPVPEDMTTERGQSANPDSKETADHRDPSSEEEADKPVDVHDSSKDTSSDSANNKQTQEKEPKKQGSVYIFN